MKELINKKDTWARGSMSVVQEYRYYCKLFNDMITQTPCLMRRKEFSGIKHLDCGGCSKDTMMNSRHNRLSALRDGAEPVYFPDR